RLEGAADHPDRRAGVAAGPAVSEGARALLGVRAREHPTRMSGASVARTSAAKSGLSRRHPRIPLRSMRAAALQTTSAVERKFQRAAGLGYVARRRGHADLEVLEPVHRAKLLRYFLEYPAQSIVATPLETHLDRPPPLALLRLHDALRFRP